MSNDRFTAIAANYEDLFSQVVAIQGNNYSEFEQTVYDEVAKTPLITGRILDIGCGDGVTSYRFVEAGCDISGVDLNDEMITSYNSRFAGRATAHKGNATDLVDFAPGDIDVVITGAAIHNIPKTDRVNFWKEILRLDPGMVVMGEKIADPDPVKHQAYLKSELWAIEQIYGRQHNLLIECQEWIEHYAYDESERLEFAEVHEALGKVYDLEVVYEMGMFKTVRGLKK
jgi:SAM-dependent methyltransferase